MNEKTYREKVDKMRESAHEQDDWQLIIQIEILVALHNIAKMLEVIHEDMPDR